MTPKNIEAVYPLSPTQEGMFFHTLLEPKSGVYFQQFCCRLCGMFDFLAFENAWQGVVDRHPVLRSLVTQKGKNKSLQVVRQHCKISLKRQDWRAFTPQKQHQQFLTFLQQDRAQGFDFEKAPLMRITLIRMEENTYQFTWSFHHLILDGWSAATIITEVFAFYEATTRNEHLQLKNPRAYREYIAWLQRQDWSKAEKFWKKELKGFTAPTSLHVGTGWSQEVHYDKETTELSETETAALQLTARKNRLTLNTLVQGAWGLLLSRYSGENDVVFGITVSGRPPELAGVEEMVGMFLNTLPIRVRAVPEMSILAWMQRLQSRQSEIREYEYSSLLEIQGWSELPRNQSLFESILLFENYPNIDALHEQKTNIEIDDVRIIEQTNYPLTVGVIPGSNLSLHVSYNCQQFDAPAIVRMMGHFKSLLAEIANDPMRPINKIPMLRENEKCQLLVAWNNTQKDYARNKSINQLFVEQVQRTPSAVAVCFQDKELTYKQLNSMASRLAHYLQTQGVRPEGLVGIYIERSLEMIIGLLGILKAGGAYVSLDPSYPPERVKYMLTDSGVNVIVCTRKHAEFLNQSTKKSHLAFIEDIITGEDNSDEDAVHLGPEPVKIAIAHVIYTSGSTGKPKGTVGTMNGLINRLAWMWNEYPYIQGEVCCQKTSLSFVDHVAEIFSPLLKGVPLVIIEEEDVKDVNGLIDILVEKEVTRIVLVPSLLQAILQHTGGKVEKLARLKYWFCSGEALTVSLAKKFYDKIPNGVLFNIYGSTEMGADATCYRLDLQNLNSLINYFLPNEETEQSNLTLWGNTKTANAITTPGKGLTELKDNFKDTNIPKYPLKLEDYYGYLSKNVFPYIVNTASPRFIGHMTSTLPSFTHDLSKLISRLNQNIVKVETSKALTLLERQTIAMLHREYFNHPNDFYEQHTQNANSALGLIVSGGTLANVAALWCARNLSLPPDGDFPGVSIAGLTASLQHHNYRSLAIVSTRSAHYSIKKAASMLGLGTGNIISIDQTKHGIMDIPLLKQCIQDCQAKRIRIIALVGIAGATETGCIDPLDDMADIAAESGIYFHVDAAWGGPVIFSDKYKSFLKGIEKADSITICGHKQLYLPQGISFCLFRKPTYLESISTTAYYQAAQGSFDFGRNSPEGSRPALSLCLHAALNLISRVGYEKLINDGIKKTHYLRDKILKSNEFELIRDPKLNILNYRYIPRCYRNQQRNGGIGPSDNIRINEVNTKLQETQFFEGQSFVSKTTLLNTHYGIGQEILVLRVVLANPLTTHEDIDFVIQNQLEIADRIIEKEALIVKDEESYNKLNGSAGIIRENRGDQGINKAQDSDDIFEKRTIPIGKPIANMRVYILDQTLEPVPVGVTGEIFVAGDGLALGYLHQEDLTNEKFINDPFSEEPNGRLFQTGDLGRYRDDGNIEFLGRKDLQIKIRGFRIELGEIEAVLGGHEEVREVAVAMRDDLPGGKDLVAYIILQDNPQSTTQELRTFLQNQLPDYMLPSSFVILDKLPQTPNGKVDRRALPAPTRERSWDGILVAPQSEMEKAIAAIWQELLHLNKISVHDNFFEIGGHSFLVLSFVARTKKDSINLTPRQILDHPTIAELALVARTGEGQSAEQGLVTGPVPLTPAMHRFLYERNSSDPHHWNLSAFLESKQHLEPKLLKKVVRHLLMHHDALRLRFIAREGGHWQANTIRMENHVPFETVDLSEVEEQRRKAAIEATAEEMQRSLNLSKGPVLRVTHFYLGPEMRDRVLLVVHHFAIGGLSLSIFLEDFATAYQQLSRDENIALPPKSTSFKQWAEALKEYAQSPRLRKELDYWLALPWKSIYDLALDFPKSKGPNTNASAREISMVFSVEDSDALLNNHQREWNTEEILIAALAKTIADWTGSHVVLFDKIGHGRSALPDYVDIARTIGFFIAYTPLVLDLSGGNSSGVFSTIRKQLRNVPHDGGGCDLLRYLCDDQKARNQLKLLPRSQVLFNFRGKGASPFAANSVLFQSATESSGSIHNPNGLRDHPLSIVGDVRNDQLKVTFVYSENLHKRSTMENLAQAFVKAVTELQSPS